MTMRISIVSGLFCLLLTGSVAGQNLMFQRYNVPASILGQSLKMPFAGGLNNPEFSAADLNNDGILDLVIFDRGGDVVLTFLNEHINGAVSYTFAPEYACNFPKMVSYALMRDYNGDGAADIFCASIAPSTQGMQVFTGYFEGNMLKFKPFAFAYPAGAMCDSRYIYYPDDAHPGLWNNLLVSQQDIPDVDDIDGDGDLDILCFPAGTSTNAWWFRNMSIEMGFGKDSLKFKAFDRCWGRFFENGQEPCKAKLGPTKDSCATSFAPDPIADDRDDRHPGATLMTFDADGDGAKELVLGNISFDCLGYFKNSGTPTEAWMTALDTAFPSNSVTVFLADFPASYYLDLDNDGKKDLVVSPNNRTIGEDRKNVWFYKNTATTGHTFELQTKSLLVSDMIDLGTVAHPVFVDVNADGLLDLVVGNSGFFTYDNNAAYNARLYLFINTGTPTQPAFNLVDNDWLHMSQYAPSDYDFAPAFGDLDGDGDLDLLIGSNLGSLYYFKNTAGADMPMTFQQDFNPMWIQMDVGVNSAPTMVDLNGDGLLDVVMGERQGNINYFENTGTPDSPQFSSTPTIQKLGAVDTDDYPTNVGYSTPTFVPTQTGTMLVTGTLGGALYAYDNVTATANAFTPLSLTWGNLDEGNRSSPALADINNDGKMELIIGNQRGGLTLYKTELVNCTVPSREVHPSVLNLQIAPNPASDWVRISMPDNATGCQWQVHNALGQVISTGTASADVFSLQVKNWGPGIYFLEVLADGVRGVGKIVVRYQK
jgi:hypothetical protein